MRKVCAWCGAFIRSDSGGSVSPGAITHGICETCSRNLLAEGQGTPIHEFLASLEVPTFMVNSEGRVQAINDPTLQIVGKTLEESKNQLGGDVFNCVNAGLPGGCGNTDLCSACTVRNTVTLTYETGESRVRVPATLRVRRNGRILEMEFFLTTEKVGERVLVQIAPAD